MKKTYTITSYTHCGFYYTTGKSIDGSLFASGRTKEEVFDNLADALMTHEGVKVSWWNKLLNKLKIY